MDSRMQLRFHLRVELLRTGVLMSGNTTWRMSFREGLSTGRLTRSIGFSVQVRCLILRNNSATIVSGTGRWIVGSNVASTMAWMRSESTDDTVIPITGWQFLLREGGTQRWEEDTTLKFRHIAN